MFVENSQIKNTQIQSIIVWYCYVNSAESSRIIILLFLLYSTHFTMQLIHCAEPSTTVLLLLHYGMMYKIQMSQQVYQIGYCSYGINQIVFEIHLISQCEEENKAPSFSTQTLCDDLIIRISVITQDAFAQKEQNWEKVIKRCGWRSFVWRLKLPKKRKVLHVVCVGPVHVKDSLVCPED